MATVGQQLLSPEAGWRRYDDSYPNIRYVGSNWENTNNLHCNYTASDSIRFNFTGNKIRVIASFGNWEATNVAIYIDGVKYIYDQSVGGALVTKIVFEKLDLATSEHTVIITGTSSVILGLKNFNIDAIDISSTGLLSSFWNGGTKSNTASMITGDRIPFHYKATANAMGVIDQLGTATGAEIPVASSATPDGVAYFVMVGYDLQGRKKLISDRNIQHSISWDTLNNAGIASGSGLPITIDSKDGFTVRLMSGGVSSTDKDNEWDKIIVESTLNETIVAGDNAVWNWNGIYSECSTTSSTTGNRIYRGGTVSGYGTDITTSFIGASVGFRPILLVSDVIEKYLLVKNNLIYNLLFEQLGSYPSDITEDLFSTKGFDSIDLNVMNQINNTISIIQWTSDKTVASKKIVSYGTPKPRFISSSDLSLDTIQCINSMTITSNATGGSKLNLVFSNDNGKSWKTFNGSDWVNVNTLDIVDVKNNGIDASLISTIKKTQWDGLISVAKSIRIGYYLEPVSGSAVDNVDKIIFNIDMKGKWGMSMPGVDYRYDYATSNSLLVSIFSSGDFKINY